MSNLEAGSQNTFSSALPDVASHTTETALSGALQWVGMSRMEMPIFVGENMRQPALVDAFVSLDVATARGIHMSRLYRETQDLLEKEQLSLSLLGQLTERFLATHTDLSRRAKISVQYEALLQRPSLKTGLKGWRSYPVTLRAEQDGTQVRFFIKVEVVYSSTCPASTALARSLNQEKFLNQFSDSPSATVSVDEVSQWLKDEKVPLATPHAQRSFARVEVEVKPAAISDYDFEDLIDSLEKALQTAVQTVVKREDEQEFARRNGSNLMFCEDAARRAQEVLRQTSTLVGYTGEFRHVESLHPHDAVAFISST